MKTFEDRKNAFERKFALDEELRFRATARRNKLLGLWAAERLGKSGPEAEAYARSVVAADFEEPGDEDVIRKVRSSLEAAGDTRSVAEIRRVMDELMTRAIQEIQAAVPVGRASSRPAACHKSTKRAIERPAPRSRLPRGPEGSVRSLQRRGT